ncbi:MAG TPA: DUF488 domain-containing protein [Stellaceae bacterium]|nr:DUF488 domain-containing protein [Stellaceae bacterium]
MPEPPTIFTIGHSTRSLAEFVALLREAGVTLLVDVRSFPRSRANPQFNAESLVPALAAEGIDYRHLSALGGRRGRRRDAAPSPNALWQMEAFRNYADYAMTEPFRAGLAELIALARRQRTAIMCAEAVWWRCHRRIIADYLLARGFPVMHIMGPGKTVPATPTPGAQPQADGTVLYSG